MRPRRASAACATALALTTLTSWLPVADAQESTTSAPPVASVAPVASVSAVVPVAPATTPSSPPLPAPREYLTTALDLIERYSVKRSSVDFPAIRRRALADAGNATSIADTYPAIEAALKSLGDRHSSFLRPANLVLQQEGKSEGYGFLAVWPARRVVTITPGGPADKGGLKVHDRIDLVDGKRPRHGPTTITLPKDANGKFPPNVTLTVTRDGLRRPLTIRLTRGQPTLVSIPQATVPTNRTIPLAGRVGYVELPGLVGDRAAQVTFARQTQALVRDLDRPARCGWVLDLRRNRGGYVAALLAGVAPLLGEGELSGTVDADGNNTRFSYRGGEIRNGDSLELTVPDPYLDGDASRPIAILISSLTGSAGESTTLAFTGIPNARLFGEHTFGLTSYNIQVKLADGAAIVITNGLFTDRSGKSYDGPIEPDERVPIDWAHVGDESDPVLARALRWVVTQPSCTRSN